MTKVIKVAGPSVLGALVADVVRTGQPQVLSDAQRQEFHDQFASVMEPYQTEKREKDFLAWVKTRDMVIF